ANVVVSLVQEILSSRPGASIIVPGDLNDYLDSLTISIFSNSGLSNLVERVKPDERYTYIYQGVSQVFDYV
ncbi:unnamed protein product, partial [marine sediment metagenome]